jgi:cytochrome P450
MQTSDVYFDPYDVEIHRDPYPTYQRLRDEAPVYYNERHDFYAVRRYDDVERGLADRQTFISGRGFPEWDVDLGRARMAPSSTVRGWAHLPLVIP